MHMDSEDKAVINTTKFVRLPLTLTSSASSLGLKATISRDLRDGSAAMDVSCHVDEVVVIEEEAMNAQQEDRLTLRKLRAALNLLTSALGNAADYKGEEYKKKVEEIGAWFAAVKSYADEYVGPAAKNTGQGEEVEALVRALRSGLKICQVKSLFPVTLFD